MSAAAGPSVLTRLRSVLALAWAGQLLAVALLAAPNAFATLARPEAAAYVGRLFLLDARISLVLGVLLLLIEQRWQRQTTPGRLRFTPLFVLPLLALFCTVAGYEALQPMLDQARGTPRFAWLHGLSMAAFAAKTLSVLALGWLSLSLNSSGAAWRA